MADLLKVALPLGDGRTASFAWLAGTIRSSGVPIGVILRHSDHAVTALWAGQQPNCRLDSLQPLTLLGSIRCSCGEVGTIERDCWVPS